MKLRSLIVLAAVLLLGAAPKGESVKQEKERLQGRWRCVTLEVDGNAILPVEVELVAPKLRIRGDDFEFDTGETWTFTLEQVGSLKQIDLKEKQPAGKGVVPVMRGIYSLDADSLKVCFGFCQTVISGKSGEIRDFTSERPTEFNTAEDSHRYLAVFKRQKP
jgi:uncharacterized protein (TIGR03067 family)